LKAHSWDEAALAQIAAGFSNRHIASVLEVDEKTIRRFRLSLEDHTKARTWMVIGDIHWPETDMDTMSIALQIADDIELDGYVWLGDQFDNSVISHHNAGKGLLKVKGAYAKEQKSFDEQILKPVESRLGTSAKRIWIKGNHDDWERQYVEMFPEFEGHIERDLMLDLAGRGWKVIECGQAFKHGDLTFIHGETLTTANHAKKALEIYCANVIYGHFHGPQSATKVLPFDQTRKWQAWCSPIAGRTNPYYLRNRPNAWVNGITMIEFAHDGSFNVFPLITSTGATTFRGKVYTAARHSDRHRPA
jgi:predicted phosphodiesterase